MTERIKDSPQQQLYMSARACRQHTLGPANPPKKIENSAARIFTGFFVSKMEPANA